MAVGAPTRDGRPVTDVPFTPPGDAQVILGEIRTGLLRNCGPVTAQTAEQLLRLIPQQVVRRWERPVRHVASPDVLTGVDCLIPSASGRHSRGVGTLATNARITGGQVLQTSTRVGLLPAIERRRLPWSQYLSRPGTVEVWAPVTPDDVISGFLSGAASPEGLDLGGPSAHRMNTIQASGLLDGAHTYRAERTRLRWAAVVTTGPARVTFSLETAQMHSLRLDVRPELAGQVADLCQDVALHDWLLTSVLALIDRAVIGGRDRAAVVATLAPGVDSLLHAWLPGARIGEELMTYWAEIDRHSGFSRQWEVAIARIRDQIALATVELATRRGER